MKIHYLNPSGNITAIVVGADESERAAITDHILSSGLAEQVGYEADCINDADACLGRLQMMGGEFCGNASRAYAYLKLLETADAGVHDVQIEISGVDSAVNVHVDLDAGSAYTDMPLPYEITDYTYSGAIYPLVRMAGIDHLLVCDREPDADFAKGAIGSLRKAYNPEACGIQFLTDDFNMTPYVYVRDSNSIVAESSCGSGSVAAAYYMALTDKREEYTLVQPGGTITVRVIRDPSGEIAHCYMGGSIDFV